jgi:hypothetical protein
MATETPEDFRDRALECERQALAARDPRAREILSYVAARWHALADEDARSPIATRDAA